MNKCFKLGYTLCVSFLFLINIKAYSKQLDTLIFKSDFEKKVFTDYLKSKSVDPIDLLIAINYGDGKVTTKKSFNNFCQELEQAGIQKLSKKKQVNLISKKIRENYTRRYVEDVYFSDLFESGNCNNITSIALYALVFQHFNIDYVIQKTPIHFYIIADSKGSKLEIETVLPTNQKVYDLAFKQNFINYLKDFGKITDFEYSTLPVNVLFEKYYLKADKIDIYQLVSLQYLNWGLKFYNSFIFAEALNYIEKAELLSSDISIKFLKRSILIYMLSDESNSKEYKGVTLSKYLNDNFKNSISLDYSKEYFKNVSNELVINHPRINDYIKYYKDFITALSDSINKTEFEQNYNTFLGYYHYTNLNYQKALYYYGNAYKCNAENVYTKQTLLELLIKNITPQNDLFDPLDKIDSLRLYFVKYPYVKDNEAVQQLFFFFYLQTIKNYLEVGYLKNVIEYIDQLEVFINGLNIYGISNSEIIARIYKEISSYYYREHNYKMAEEYINHGLKKFPNSRLLLQTLEDIKDFEVYAVKNNYDVNNSTKMLDLEAYNILVSKANKNRSAINSNLDKILTNGKWRVESVVVNNKIVSLPSREKLELHFFKDNKAIIKEWKIDKECTWSYDNRKNVLVATDSSESIVLKIMIYEIDEKMIKSVMYFNDSDDKIILFIKSID